MKDPILKATEPRKPQLDSRDPLVIVEACGCEVYFKQLGVNLCPKHGAEDTLRVKHPAPNLEEAK